MLIFASGRYQTLIGAVVCLVAIYQVRAPSRINQFSHLYVTGVEDFVDQAWCQQP